MPKPRVLLMQTGDVPDSGGLIPGNFDDMFLRMADYSGLDVRVVHVANGGKPEAPSSYAGVLVTGSPAMVTEKLPWSEAAAAWLRACIEGGGRVLGVCYGHQLIAHAFGGLVGYHAAGMELGTHRIILCDGAARHPMLRHLPSSFWGNVVHSQSVLVPPAEAETVARSEHDPHQMLSYGDNALTVQFHPEMDAAVMRGYVRHCAGIDDPRQAPDDAHERIVLGVPLRDTPVAAGMLQTFLDACAE